MNTSNIVSGGAGVIAGFFLGFFIANTFAGAMYARRAGLQTGASTRGPGSSNDASDPSDPALHLSDDELRQAIRRADAEPDNIQLQRDFGIALYRYASETRDPRFLADAARCVKRAVVAAPADHDLLVTLGNIFLDIGQTTDTAGFARAREYYIRALTLKPDDAAARANLGSTYYLGAPRELKRAVEEYRRALLIDPKYEPALEYLARALLDLGETPEAEQRIGDLERVNASNSALPGLRAELAQRRNSSSQIKK